MFLWAQGSFLPLLFSLLTPLPPAPRSIFPPGGIWPHLSQIHLASQIPSCRRITLPSASLRPAEQGWGRGADTPYPAVLDSSAHGTELFPGHQRAQPGSKSAAHPGAASIPSRHPDGSRRDALSSPSAAEPHPGTRRGQRYPRLGDPPRLPPPRPPLPACTVRRRRRKAAAQPQRRVATGRVPVSLAMASQAHLPGAAHAARPGLM